MAGEGYESDRSDHPPRLRSQLRVVEGSGTVVTGPGHSYVEIIDETDPLRKEWDRRDIED